MRLSVVAVESTGVERLAAVSALVDAMDTYVSFNRCGVPSSVAAYLTQNITVVPVPTDCLSLAFRVYYRLAKHGIDRIKDHIFRTVLKS